MNIVLTTDYFPPHVGGGVERVVFHLASELVRLGHEVAVVTLNTNGGEAEEVLNGIDVYRAKPIELTRKIGVQSAVSVDALKMILEVCRIKRADVLHANNLYFFTTISACLIRRLIKKPLVTTLHVASITEFEGAVRYLAASYEKSIGRWLIHQSDHIVAVSNAVMRSAVSLGASSSKVSVVPNAVDTEEFRPARNKERNEVIRVALVGRLVWNKGPQYLVEAAPSILHDFDHVEFLIVGDGPMLEQLQERVRSLGAERHFRFMGLVPNVSEFMQKVDILVRPSLTDGMPLTVLEAMACGVPCVASKVGGTPEILTDGGTGFLVEPKNIEQLSSRISALLSDPRLRTAMGRRAREFAERYYSWPRVAQRMIEIYRNVADKP